MTEPRLVATSWTSAGNTSPMQTPGTSPVPIAERLTAVADAGFCGLGLVADDLIAIRALAPVFIKIGSENGPPAADSLALAEPLYELAEQAAAHGTRVAIETMPFSAIATVPTGAEIIRAAGHPGAGLLVDAWHVFRAGTNLAELRIALAPAMIFGVELDDAAPDAVGTLYEDTVEHRLLCGEGSFDLIGLVQVLRELGFDGPWGVDILSESFRALPVGEALELAAKSARTLL